MPIGPSPGSPASSRSDAMPSCSSLATAIGRARRSGSSSACGRPRPRKRRPSITWRSSAKRRGPEQLTLDPPLITALVASGREKRRDVPLKAHPEAHGPGGPRDRGSAVLRSRRRRSDRDCVRRLGLRVRPQGVLARRQHADAAAHQEHVPDAGTEHDPQAAGSVHGAHPGAPPDQGSGPRALSQ